ncbi:BNS1 protein [Beauveria bassiana ARSEF 2860]|uniref:BNS1 protein n=1 Tax=Beauveria bassiana (strain ARSEF 2860) TaxID=655819 RepID=J4KQ59_BEAB2|nr:BNS1 protein [Beauveria bassiana ARSEF 2860]EJP68634.1 BNS1 protein [Beauveria bassiana ARSEF 2860]
MSSHVLGNKDVNASMEQQQQQTAQSKDVKSMDYHRQVFQSKMAQEPYVTRKPASAPSSRLTTPAATVAASRPVVLFRPAAVLAKNTATSSDASSCSASFSSSSSCSATTTSSSSTSSLSPVPSLISDSSSCAPSPTPSITALPRLPTNKNLVASTQQYVSPSDNIMSPCSAKINALRNKHVSKAKPKSLFAQASAKKLSGENLFGSKSIPKD